jgi:HEAT repeat protein
MEIEGGSEMFTEYASDGDSRVRAAAVEALGNYPRAEVASLLERMANEDSSLIVLTSCIRTLGRIDSVRGFDLAASHAGVDSYRDMVRSASLNALRRLKDPRAVSVALRFLGPSYETSTRLIALGILEDVGKSDSMAVIAMRQLADNANNRIRLGAIRALDGWGDVESRQVLRDRREAETDPGIIEAIDEALGR